MKGSPKVDPSISHTFKVGNQEIALVSDPAHCLKNIRTCFLERKVLIMPDKYVEEHGLSTNEINYDVFEKMVTFDQERELQVVPHLSAKILKLQTGRFKKMDVGICMKLLSWKTASALRWLIKNYPEEFPHYYTTTAVFIEYIAQWWEIMKSRSVAHCFHSQNPLMWEKNMTFLKKFLDFWGTIKVHSTQTRAYWPIQKSALLSTTSIMKMAEKMVHEDGYVFFLPGRCLNDAIENFFSCVRQFNKNPSALMFQRFARAICVSQFLKYSPSSSYEEDDSERFLVELEDYQSKTKSQEDHEEEEDLDIIEDEEMLEKLEKEDYDPEDYAETCSLANLGASMLKKTIKSKRGKCEKCTKAFTVHGDEDTQPENTFIKQASYTETSLTFPSRVANKMFLSAELVFRSQRVRHLERNKNLGKLLLDKVLTDFRHEFPDVPKCHLKIIFGRFLRTRCHQWARKSNERFVAAQKEELDGQADSSKSTYQIKVTNCE